jgi:hypothetical protein
VTDAFLSAVSDTPLEEVDLFSLETQWIGRRFSLQGCAAIVYPSPADGWLLQSVRGRAAPLSRTFLVFEGQTLEAPPVMRNAQNVIADRLLVPLGIIGRPDRFMLIVVAPEECADAVEALDWPESLQSGEG